MTILLTFVAVVCLALVVVGYLIAVSPKKQGDEIGAGALVATILCGIVFWPLAILPLSLLVGIGAGYLRMQI